MTNSNCPTLSSLATLATLATRARGTSRRLLQLGCSFRLPLASLLLVLVTSATLGARAENRISLEASSPSPTTASVGEIVPIDLAMAFDDTTIGGGFQVDFDPSVFELVDFAFATRSLGDEPVYRCSPSTGRCTGRGGAHRVPIGFGRFDGLSGLRPIGQLRLRAIAEGASPIRIEPYATTGGFVDLEGRSLETTTDTLSFYVPEPGSTILLSAGVLALGVLSRRRTAILGAAVGEASLRA